MSEVIKKGVYIPVQERPVKYSRTYVDEDGTVSIWKYDSSTIFVDNLGVFTQHDPSITGRSQPC